MNEANASKKMMETTMQPKISHVINSESAKWAVVIRESGVRLD
ncbi:hypothetical protein CBM2634_B140100 [Cupriavidus taiwanensis]|uniref:Uncharacterized protein n=1 Tax=Cupriavidus taiwanensis TaxID=164546 RepID=A0A375J4H7_9BURK|nr:hypothetical protein CBM2634_B140100 [Cupriavidus taiwanensis]